MERSTRTDYRISDTGSDVEIGDINNDGKPDLVAANWGDSISVMINETASGDTVPHFRKAISFSSGLLAGTNSIALADMNNDGKLDLAISNQFPDINSVYHIAILFNITTVGDSIPKFTNYVSLLSGEGPFDVVIADFDLNALPDVAIANFTSGTVSVFLNFTQSGSLTPAFNSKNDFPVGSGAMGIDAADLNGDGYIDIAVANQNSDNISILMNTTAGTSNLSFGNHIDFPGEAGPNSMNIQDVDGDGKPELIVTNSSAQNIFSIFFNGWSTAEFNPYFGDMVSYNVGELPVSIAAADFNGDGKIDIATANQIGQSISVLLNTSIITGIKDQYNIQPVNFVLNQNYPNPFNPSTVITYQISENSKINLSVYDVLGRKISELVNDEKPAGNYKINFNANGLASGIYFYKLSSQNIKGSFVQTRKMILLK